MKFTGFLLCICLFMFSCRTKLEERSQILIINPEEALHENVYLSEIASDVIYIPISNEKLFENIHSVDYHSNVWFVQTSDHCICMYDQHGKIIGKVDHKGKGPNEYEYLNSFTVDEENEIIYVLFRNNVLSYNYSGDFINRFQTKKIYPTSIYFQKSKLYLFAGIRNGDNELNWLILDPTGNEIASKKSSNTKPYKTKIAIAAHPFFKYNDEIRYWNVLNDTVFSIDNIKHSARFLFAKGDFRITENGLNLNEGKDFFSTYYFIETNDYLILNTIYYGSRNYLLIYKSDNKSYFINNDENSIGFLNDYDGGLNFTPRQQIILNGTEYIVGYNQSYDLIAHVSSDAFKNSTPKYPEKKKQLEQLANSLDENDNPVLMLVKLKE